MRKKTILISALCSLILIITSSCHPRNCCAPIPAAVTNAAMNFEIVDNNGKSLINSLKDSVKISYYIGTQIKYDVLSVRKLQVSQTDTTSVKYYNGLVVSDNTDMLHISSGPQVINNFFLYVNGVKMGEIYLRYVESRDSHSPIYYSSLMFNRQPIIGNQSFAYYTGGSDLFVFQKQ